MRNSSGRLNSACNVNRPPKLYPASVRRSATTERPFSIVGMSLVARKSRKTSAPPVGPLTERDIDAPSASPANNQVRAASPPDNRSRRPRRVQARHSYLTNSRIRRRSRTLRAVEHVEDRIAAGRRRRLRPGDIDDIFSPGGGACAPPPIAASHRAWRWSSPSRAARRQIPGQGRAGRQVSAFPRIVAFLTGGTRTAGRSCAGAGGIGVRDRSAACTHDHPLAHEV